MLRTETKDFKQSKKSVSMLTAAFLFQSFTSRVKTMKMHEKTYQKFGQRNFKISFSYAFWMGDFFRINSEPCHMVYGNPSLEGQTDLKQKDDSHFQNGPKIWWPNPRKICSNYSEAFF